MKSRIENLIIKSKKRIDWNVVENYLQRYDKKEYIVNSTNDIIKIDKHFIDEYTGSIHTRSLKGTMALIKANIPTILENVIKNAFNRMFEENRKLKHKSFAKKGWYNYNSIIEMPVRNNNGNIISYNDYSVRLIVRITNENKLYLYDIVDIKKEIGNPL